MLDVFFITRYTIVTSDQYIRLKHTRLDVDMMFRLAEYARIQQGIIILPPSLQKDFELLPLKWFGALLFLQKIFK